MKKQHLQNWLVIKNAALYLGINNPLTKKGYYKETYFCLIFDVDNTQT